MGQILGDKNHTSIAIDDNGGGISTMLHALGQLIVSGVDVNIAKLFEGRDCLDITIDKIATAKRTPVTPKHAWLLNGSKARKFGEPVKQVGITVEEFKQRKAVESYTVSIR